MAESAGESMPPGESAGLPTEAPKAKPWGKILAVVIVLIVIIAAIAVWRLAPGAQPPPPPPGETAPAITNVEITSGATGNVGSVGAPVGFRATATGTIADYTWDFGDGQTTKTTTNATTDSVTHTYTVDGTYIVLVTAKSPGGKTATSDARLVQVNVLDSAFVPDDTKARAVAIVAPTVATLGAPTVTADGSSSHGFINCATLCEADTSLAHTWAWSWGDGQTTANASQTTHIYAAAGNYAVTLTVTVLGGAKDSTVMTVRITPGVSLVKNPGVLVIASIGDPQYLDPAIDYETSGNEVIKNVYDRLVQRKVTATDPNNPTIQNDQFVGMAASSWTVSPDQRTWNFTIRTGIHWQDSQYGDMDAYDVEYSLRRALLINIGPTWIIDQYLTAYASDVPATPQNERWAAINASVVATDARHVELRLAQVYGAILQTLDYQVASIVSKRWVQANGGTQPNTQNAYVNRHMMGSGPFKLDHWTPGVELKLVKNPTYWGTTKPRLDAVLFKQVPEPATQELLLKNGDVDWADGIPTRDIRTVMTWEGVVVRQNPSLVVQYMGMVEDNSWPGDPLRTPNTSPFQDVHVRRAVAYAFDYNFVQQQVLSGFATQLKSGIPQGMPGWDGSFWNYNTNPTAAKAEIAQAANPVWRGGFDTTLSYNSGNPVRAQIATMVQAQLKTVLNINVTIQAVSWPTHLDNMDFRRAGLVLIGWAPDYLDPDDYLKPLFHSSACPMPAGGNPLVSNAGSNNACYRNPIVDRAIDNATRTADWQARLRNYTVAQQYIVQEAAWVFNYQPTSLDPARTWVKGYYFDPMELRDFLYLFK